MCSTRSSARLISSTASWRRNRSGSQIESGAPLSRERWKSRVVGEWMECKREIISREPRGQFVRLLGRAVIEMPARAKQLDRGNSRARRFAHQSGRQFPVHKKICGENALHRHNVRALCIRDDFDSKRSFKSRQGKPVGQCERSECETQYENLEDLRLSGLYSSSKNSASGGPGISPASTPRFRNS